MNIHEVILRPLLTEKGNIGREMDNLATFAVDPRANKHEIQRAVEESRRLQQEEWFRNEFSVDYGTREEVPSPPLNRRAAAEEAAREWFANSGPQDLLMELRDSVGMLLMQGSDADPTDIQELRHLEALRRSARGRASRRKIESLRQ